MNLTDPPVPNPPGGRPPQSEISIATIGHPDIIAVTQDGTGNGPYYTGRVRVIGPDVFKLDSDGDGWGCEPVY